MSEFPAVKYKDPNGEWCSYWDAHFSPATTIAKLRPGYTEHRFTGEVDANKVPWYEGDEGWSKFGGHFKVVLCEGRFVARFMDGSKDEPLYWKDLATHTPPAKKYKRRIKSYSVDGATNQYFPDHCIEVDDERVSDRRTGTKRPERKTGRTVMWCHDRHGFADEANNVWRCGKPVGRRSGPEDRRTAQRRKPEGVTTDRKGEQG